MLALMYYSSPTNDGGLVCTYNKLRMMVALMFSTDAVLSMLKYNHCLTSQWILGMIVYTLLSCNIEMLNNVRTRLLITLKPSICPPTSASFLSLKLPLSHSPQI